MPQEMQQQLQATWRRIQEKLPATRFNFDFWRLNRPRRATYPACRAVIAARHLQPDSEDAMILAVQEAYYLKALNPSDDAVLIRLAEEIGLNDGKFADLLNDAATSTLLQREIEQGQRMGAHSFPSLILQQGQGYWPIPVDYFSAGVMLETIELLTE